MFSKKESLLGNLISFIIKPKYDIQKNNKPFYLKFFDVLRILAFGTLITVPIMIAIIIVVNLFKFKSSDNAIAGLLANNSPFVIILLIVIIGPLTEELTFRFGLKLTRASVSVSLTFLLIIMVDLLRLIQERLPSQFRIIPSWLFSLRDSVGLVSYLTFIFLVTIIFYMIFVSLKVEFKFLKKHYRFTYYLSAIIFGALHITNYQNIGLMILFAPLLVAPQIIAGFNLGYIRLKYGFNWGYLYHMLFNAALAIPSILLYMGSSNLKQLGQTTNVSTAQITASLNLTDGLLIFAMVFIYLFEFLLMLLLSLQMIIEWIIVRQQKLSVSR